MSRQISPQGVRRKAEVVPWKLTIPIELACEVDLLCINPILGKPIYGARSQLVTDLLRTHLEKIKKVNNDVLNKPDANSADAYTGGTTANEPAGDAAEAARVPETGTVG